MAVVGWWPVGSDGTLVMVGIESGTFVVGSFAGFLFVLGFLRCGAFPLAWPWTE
jgi:hypothetical protein